MTDEDSFEATFVVETARTLAWQRLTGTPGNAGDGLWLAGFDAQTAIIDADEANRLSVVKRDEPCAGTSIIVTLEDSESGTRIRVVQSGFGDWLQDRHDMMELGWTYIVADLHAYLATGVKVSRFMRAWGDFGADMSPYAGGLRVRNVAANGVAASLGLQDDDLLVEISNAPTIALQDVNAALLAEPAPHDAMWIRGGSLMRSVT